MNQFWTLTLLVCAMALTGCGVKKSKNGNEQSSSQYSLGPFEDINNPSTLNLDELKGLPEIVDLKNEMTPAKDQGNRGTCSFFTATALAEAAIKRKMNVEVNLSEEHLSNVVKTKGYYSDTEGGFPIQNLIMAIDKKEGFLLERDWPYQPSWFAQKSPCLNYASDNVKAPAVCFTHNAPPASVLAKKIPAEKFELTYFRTETTNEIISFLAQSRMPLSVILPVNDRGWTNDGQAKYTEEMRSECVSAAVACGTHAVVLTGYDLKKKVFYFKNSWNKKWGTQGFGTIPFDVVDRHVDHAFSMVDLKEDLDLPTDFDKDYLALRDFEVQNEKLSNGALQVRLSGVLDNVDYYAIKTSSTLVRRRGISSPNDTNSFPLELTIEEQALFQNAYITTSRLVIPDNKISNLDLASHAVGTMDFSASVMNTNTAKSFKNVFAKDLFVKASVSVFTDDDGYVEVGTNYDQLDP